MIEVIKITEKMQIKENEQKRRDFKKDIKLFSVFPQKMRKSGKSRN